MGNKTTGTVKYGTVSDGTFIYLISGSTSTSVESRHESRECRDDIMPGDQVFGWRRGAGAQGAQERLDTVWSAKGRWC